MHADFRFRLALGAVGVLLVALVVAIGAELVRESWLSIQAFGLGFWTSHDWDPVAGQFGALPFIWGTLYSSLLALLLATPVALGIAIFISELCPRWLREPLTFLTELTSNVATVSTFLPLLAATAVSVGVDPRLILVPATISTSCAFMLPIGTPPNAIVFGSGLVRMGQMARYGFALNLIGVVIVALATFALLVPQLGISLDAMPEWARR